MNKANKTLIPYARNLRKNMTKEERRLWYNYLKVYPVRFRRQEIIGNYIADFYCSSAKLAIELDGSQHYEEDMLVKDAVRTSEIGEYGIAVVRFPNNAVNGKFRDVCEYIDCLVRSRTEV